MTMTKVNTCSYVYLATEMRHHTFDKLNFADLSYLNLFCWDRPGRSCWMWRGEHFVVRLEFGCSDKLLSLRTSKFRMLLHVTISTCLSTNVVTRVLSSTVNMEKRNKTD